MRKSRVRTWIAAWLVLSMVLSLGGMPMAVAQTETGEGSPTTGVLFAENFDGKTFAQLDSSVWSVGTLSGNGTFTADQNLSSYFSIENRSTGNDYLQMHANTPKDTAVKFRFPGKDASNGYADGYYCLDADLMMQVPDGTPAGTLFDCMQLRAGRSTGTELRAILDMTKGYRIQYFANAGSQTTDVKPTSGAWYSMRFLFDTTVSGKTAMKLMLYNASGTRLFVSKPVYPFGAEGGTIHIGKLYEFAMASINSSFGGICGMDNISLSQITQTEYESAFDTPMEAKLSALTYTVTGGAAAAADGFSATQEGGTYTVTLPAGTSSVTVGATAQDPKAKVKYSPSGGLVDLSSGSGTATVTVTGQNPVAENVYTIHFTVAQATPEPTAAPTVVPGENIFAQDFENVSNINDISTNASSKTMYMASGTTGTKTGDVGDYFTVEDIAGRGKVLKAKDTIASAGNLVIPFDFSSIVSANKTYAFEFDYWMAANTGTNGPANVRMRMVSDQAATNGKYLRDAVMLYNWHRVGIYNGGTSIAFTSSGNKLAGWVKVKLELKKGANDAGDIAYRVYLAGAETPLTDTWYSIRQPNGSGGYYSGQANEYRGFAFYLDTAYTDKTGLGFALDNLKFYEVVSQQSNNAKLAALTYQAADDPAVSVPSFTAADEGGDYSVALPAGTTSVTVNAVKAEDVQVLNYSPANGVVDVSNGSGTATITVAAEDGTTNQFVVHFMVEAATALVFEESFDNYANLTALSANEAWSAGSWAYANTAYSVQAKDFVFTPDAGGFSSDSYELVTDGTYPSNKYLRIKDGVEAGAAFSLPSAAGYTGTYTIEFKYRRPGTEEPGGDHQYTDASFSFATKAADGNYTPVLKENIATRAGAVQPYVMAFCGEDHWVTPSDNTQRRAMYSTANAWRSVRLVYTTDAANNSKFKYYLDGVEMDSDQADQLWNALGTVHDLKSFLFANTSLASGSDFTTVEQAVKLDIDDIKITIGDASPPVWSQAVVDKAVAASPMNMGIDLNFTWSNKLAVSEAMYMLALMGYYNPSLTSTNGTKVTDRLLSHIQKITTGGNEPSCRGALGGWSDGPVAQSLVLAKKTPDVWNALTADQKARCDFIMKCMAVAGNYTENYENDPKTDLSQSFEYTKSYNPNFQEGYVGIMSAAYLYFGGADAVNAILADFDYDTYTAQMDNYGFTNMKQYFILTGKQLLENGGTDANGGTTQGAKIPFTYKNLATGARVAYEPSALFGALAQKMYSLTCSSTVLDSSGVVRGRISDNSQSPYEGQTGMCYEFNSMDASGLRTSADYVFKGWRNSVPTRATIQALGYWNTAQMADIENRMYVGSEDFLYKIDDAHGGYIGYSNGSTLGAQSKTTFINQGQGWEYLEEIWNSYLKN